MAYKNYMSYSAQIRKSDHIDHSGKADLHVHVYFNERKKRKLLGRYRLPTLEPVFPQKEPELNRKEISFLQDWLAQETQIKKLNNFLKETLFDMHKIGSLSEKYGQIITDKKGDTYITIRIPVSERIK